MMRNQIFISVVFASLAILNFSCNKSNSKSDFLKESERVVFRIYGDDKLSIDDRVIFMISAVKNDNEEIPIKIYNNLKEPDVNLLITADDIQNYSKENPITFTTAFKNIAYHICLETKTSKEDNPNVYIEKYDPAKDETTISEFRLDETGLVSTMIIEI